MRRKKQQLLKRQARIRWFALAGYLVLIVGAGGAWAMYSRAASSCSPASPCVQPGTSISTSDWSLTFSDEFDTPTLDTGKWNTARGYTTTAGDEPFNGRREGAYFTSDNVSVQNGAAVIKLTKSTKTVAGSTYKYASGVLNTEHKFYMKPGQYVEARIKVPKCSGCWPAFWAIPSGKVPPEFDMFEFFNTAQRSRPTFNYHYDDGRELGVVPYGEPGADYRNDYHVFGMYWTGDTAVPYLDGKAYPLGVGATTKQDEFIIFNLSTFAGTSPVPSQMQIDWVRVWAPPEPKQAAVVTLVASASNAASTPTPAPRSTPALQPGTSTTRAMREAIQISGLFEVTVPDGATSHSVMVDGTPTVTGNRIDTRLLTNGPHVVTVRSTGPGRKTSTVTATITVANELTWVESTRNMLFAPFHGNTTLIGVADLIFFLLMVAGVGVAWYIIRFRPRTYAVGLN